jgi:hypothetical protein
MGHPRRTKHFIDASVQGTLARRLIFHWCVFLIVTSVAAFLLQVLTNPFESLAVHAQELWFTHGPMLVVMIFLLPVFVVDTIKLSNRFAGPIFSLRRSIRSIVQGKPAQKLKFRRHDFWHDLADDYNAMLLRLELLNETDAQLAEEEQLATSGK